MTEGEAVRVSTPGPPAPWDGVPFVRAPTGP